ncbi:MAG: PAS domain S-box protein [Nitrospira sp.]
MLGYSPAELRTMTVHDLNPDFQADQWPAFWAESRRCKSMTFESCHRAKQGQLIPIELQVNYLAHDGQEFHCAFVRNITERKQVEQTLAERTRLAEFVADLSLVINQDQSVVALLDRCIAKTIQHLNIPFVRVWTIEPSDACGRCENIDHCTDQTPCPSLHLHNSLSTKLQGEFPPALQGAVKLGRIAQELDTIWTNDVLHDDRLPDKQWMQENGLCSFAGIPLIVENRVFGILGIFSTTPLSKPTISALESVSHGMAAAIARKLMAEDLRRSKAQLSDIMENHPAVVYTRHVGDEWPFTFVTPNIFGLLGYTSIDLISDTGLWDSLMHPDDLATLMAEALPEFLRKGTHTFVVRLRHRDGQYHWIENQARLTHLGNGPLLMVGTMTDVTERMRAAESLRESEARNRSILDSALDAVVSINAHGHIIGWNPEAELMFGYSAQEVLGLPLDETIIPARYRQAHAHGMSRLLQSADGPAVRRRFEFFALHRDRHEFPVEFAIASVQINGQPTFSAFIRDITERTRAETALRESEERYRTLIELSPSGVFVFSEGRIVYVNSMTVTLLGAAGPGDILDRSPFDFIHPDYHEDVTTNLRRVLAGEATVHRAERVYVKMDGTSIYVQVEAVRITWNGLPAIQGFFSDITERKQAEAALQTSEEKLRQALQASNTGLWDWNTETNDVSLSREWKRQLGYEPAEIPDAFESWQAHLHPDDHDQAVAHVQTYLANPVGDYQQEFRLRHKDGTYRWIEARASLVTELDGRRVRLLGSHMDITERKRTEEALQRSERQLRTVLDTLPIGVWFTDEKGHVLYGNPVGQRIWADAARVGLPQPGADTLWWETIEKAGSPHRWAVGIVLARGHDLSNEMFEIETTGGDRRTIRNSAVPVKGDSGEILGAIVLNEDITDRVRAEQALRQEHALLMAVMDAATDIIFVKDITGRYIHMNRAGAHTLGMAVEEVIGWNEYALWPSDLAASCQLADRHVLETGEPVTVEETSVIEGKPTTYLTTKAPYRDPEGRIIGIIGVARDITERKYAEEALRSSEERFAKAFRSSPSPIGITEVETGCCVDANDACLELFGFRREEVIEKTTLLLGIWPTPDDRAKLIEQLQSGKAVRNVDLNFKARSGEIHHILVSSDFITLNGKLCLITVGSDITEQKRAEKDLLKSHAFIRQIIDTDPNFIFAKDRNGRFTLVNKAVAEAYGTTVENLIGKTDADFNKNPEQVANFLRKDRDVIEHLRDQFIPEECITDATGAIRWLQTVKRPILDESGQATMVLGAATDITERKQMEEALRQRERDLRAAIDERERISQDLHDGILQSLYAVGLGLEACKPLMTHRHYKTAVATMSEAIGQLNHVMSEVRNFIAGLESQVLQGSTFPAALQEMVNTLAAAHPTHCTVSVDEPAASHISTEQALHLLNIVREALSNSLRHAQATKATVTLKPLTRSIRLSIVDNGIGFEPASMLGVGHGLTNMAARARKVGGRFAIKSAPHHGTRITIDLPKENRHAESESAYDSTPARR